MILDQSTKLEAVLSGAVAASQPEVHVSYRDWTQDGQKTIPANYPSVLSSASDVTILPAPTKNPIREPFRVSIYNKDSSPVTVTVKTDDGTERIIIKATLATLEVLAFEKGRGWYALNSSGSLKNST